MKKVLLFALVICFQFSNAQSHVLIGYWHNWNVASSPYIPLNQIDSRYNVVCVSFAVPTSPSDMNMLFTPDGITQANFIAQVQALQSQGKKVLISIGGATTSISLPDTASRDAFANTMTGILNTYGFDGIDIDIEHGNSIMASGTIASPTSADCINLIAAINTIKNNYLTAFSRNMMLTFAPETAYVQGGMSAYGGIWGGYLPLINAFRNDLNYIHVQLYNSGNVYGIDGNIYTQGNADFIVAMTEAVIHGFNTAGGMFVGLPANKVAVGLPACPSAAGGGFVTTADVSSAMKYLMGTGAQPGSYVLNHTSGYPTLGGMMTWSINWDKVSSCNASSYEYAQNFESLFPLLSVADAYVRNNKVELFPNPASDKVYLRNNQTVQDYTIINSLGREVQQGKVFPNEAIYIDGLASDVYLIKINGAALKFIKKQ